MPEKDKCVFGVSNGGFISVDGEWIPLGRIEAFDVVEGGAEHTPAYEDIRASMTESCSFEFKVPWWFDWSLIMGGLLYPACHIHSRWTIRTLRRGGKSHRGKHA